jgi:epsin
MDEERLRAERADRKSWKSRVTGIEDFPADHPRQRPQREHRQRRPDEEDLEYRLAIEASKNEAEQDKLRRERGSGAVDDDDDDLAKAIKLSKEEEELRRRELEETNASALFDEPLSQPAQPQPTGWNQGYQQQGAVDWFGNPVGQQQSQNTGFLQNAYAQPTGVQGQNGFGFQQQQQQPTGYDAFGQQQFLQPQQTSFNMNNPYSQPPQQNGLEQQQNTLQPGSNNPWSGSSHTTESIQAQPTGSNNPFASSFQQPRPQTAGPSASRAPTLNTLQEQKTQTQFSSNFNPPVSFAAQPQSPPQPQPSQEQNPHHAQLNALLASGDGQDTFGNTGNLRIPAQHTAPGTFVNSAGAGANRVIAQQTGNNPFLNSQFTGMPQQTGFTQPNRMVPAQTGPAGAFGGGNPFGGQQRQQQQPQTGSLIDL